MAKSNNLTMTKIKKDYQEANKKETHTFKDGMELKFYPIFQAQKIESLLEEFGEKMKHVEESEIEFTDKMFIYYIYFLCVKYFTDLNISDKFETQMSQFEWLTNHDYFSEMINEMFLQDEVAKVWNKATEVTATYQLMDKLNNDIVDKFQDLDIKNRDVLEKAFQNKNLKDTPLN